MEKNSNFDAQLANLPQSKISEISNNYLQVELLATRIVVHNGQGCGFRQKVFELRNLKFQS